MANVKRKVKFPDYDLHPDDCLKMVSNKETEICQKMLKKILEDSGKWIEARVGTQGQSGLRDVLWLAKYEFWWCYNREDSRHWNAFGLSNSTNDLIQSMNSITCEINPPIESSNNRTTGRFLKDDDGNYYLAHIDRFNFQSKKIYIGDTVEWPKVNICDRVQTAFIVSKLNDTNVISNLKIFIQTVQEIKDETRGKIPNPRKNQPPINENKSKGYGIQDIINDGCFVPQSKLAAALKVLRRKKNIILQGPPGTGKTWLAKKLAHALIDDTSSDRILQIQFHPNMSYEDFIRGWRPAAKTDSNNIGGLELVDGPFLKTANDARKDPDHKYIIIIEEIDRGNPANIFGEMLTLLEADKRDESKALRLSYMKKGEDSFYIPPNLYIIGTMNAADRSIAMMDMALRRRFGFMNLHPVFGTPWKQYMRKTHKVDNAFLDKIERNLLNLNKTIRNYTLLGSDFEIGHSYVVPSYIDIIDSNPEEWFAQVVENEIAPLLKEYWPQDAEKAKSEAQKLLEA